MAPSACQWFGVAKLNDINILVLQQLADVGVAFDLLAVVPALLDLPVKDLLVHVAQRDQAGAFDLAQALDVTHAAPAEPDDGDADIAVRARRARNDGRPGFALRAFLGAHRRKQAKEAVVRSEDLRKLRRSSLIHSLCNCSLDAAEQALGYTSDGAYFTYCLILLGDLRPAVRRLHAGKTDSGRSRSCRRAP